MSVSRWAAAIKHQRWLWRDTYSLGAIGHLTELLHEVVPQKTDRLYGYTFIFNNQSNSTLGTDGYDNYQAPTDDGKQLFARRMWVNGSLSFFHGAPRPGDVIDCEERVTAVRTVGLSVFVGIKRDFSRDSRPFMLETRMLMYTNEPYKAPEDAKQLDTQPTHEQEVLRQMLSISRSQLMRFSALSYNLHKIHYDRAHCTSEGLRNIIVSGPFLVLLMLHCVAASFPDREITSFKYKNSGPCYIDENVDLVISASAQHCTVRIDHDGRTLCGGTAQLLPQS